MNLLSDYASQESSQEEQIKTFVAQNSEMINQKRKSDKLKAQIMNKMENGVNLSEIFDYFPELVDQQMMAEFWGKLEDYARILSKKN